MNFKKAFPSRYLQVSDMDEGPLTLTIARVNSENVGGEHNDLKLVVGFNDYAKALVCNLTRAEAIAELAGSPDTDNWPGTRVRLVRSTTRFQGKRVGCIAVEAPSKDQPELDDAVGF